MDVCSRTPSVIAGNGDDGDLPSLVDGVRAGRPAALGAARSHACARRFTPGPRGSPTTPTTADDVTQDVLIGLERRVRRFDGTSRFSTWLFAVTRNVALSRAPPRRAHARSCWRAQRDARRRNDRTIQRAIPMRRASPRSCSRYFDALPRRQRLDLRALRHSRAGAGRDRATLGMEQVTVRAHLFKARNAIRERMLEHHERLLKEYRS